MKKLLACLFLSVPTFAVTNGQVNISSGTGFYTVDISSTSAGNARQNITIADPTLVPGLATVDPLTGLTVHLATSSANQPVNFNGISQPVLAATGTAPVYLTNNTTGQVSNFPQTYTVTPGTGIVPVVLTSTQPIQIFGSTLAVSGVQGIVQTVITSTPPIQVFGTTIAVTNVSGQNLNVAGSLTVVSLSSGQINTPVPQVATYNGFISPSGTVQAAAVTLTSQTIVYVANPATVTVTGTVPVVLTSTPPIQIFGSTIAISSVQSIVQTVLTSTPPVTVIQSTSGAVQVGSWYATLLSTPPVTVTASTVGVNGVVSDSAPFTLGTSPGLPMMGVFLPSMTPLASTTTAAARMTSYRSIYITPMDANGVILGTSTANPLIIGHGGTAQPVVIIGTAPVTVSGSTIAISGIQGIVQMVVTSTPPVQVFGSTIAVSAVQGIVQTVVTSTPPVQVFGSTFAAVGMYADNGVATTTNRVTTLPGIYQNTYHGGVVGTQGKDGGITIGTDGLVWVAGLPAIRPYSYVASTGSFSIASSTNDVAALCGNAKDTILLYALRGSCLETTAGIINMAVVKRSSAYQGVWSSITIVGESSNYVATNSTAVFFTSANMVPGTSLGFLDYQKVGCMASGTATPNDGYFSPSDWKMKPIVLNSASECVGLNVQGATISGGTMGVTFNYLEIQTNNFNP
jgi:hypothetical protein